MKAERWRQIETLFHAARELKPGEREELLAKACAGDEELRREIDSLLSEHDRGGSVLGNFASGLAAEWAQAQEPPRIGQTLDHFRILSQLGKGGMGEVYRAVDTRLKRTVAIKFAKENFSERFEREARAIAALNHPNICTLYDVGPNYLVMELIEGPTLAERIKQGTVPVEEALDIARQIADALEAAHEKGVVHRDLKPGNIKIKPDGIVKVLDFGLARVAPVSAGDSSAESTATHTTRAGMIMGTAAYMSPEQAQGKQVDKGADIWAFGVLLYEMVTGRSMFQRETVSDTLAAVLTKEPDWKRVPAKVRRLLQSCLQKDPKQRLQAIGDWRLLLEGTPQDTALRHSRGPWVAAALAVVVALALGWIAWRATRPVDHPLMRFSTDLGPEAVKGDNITAAISPDGTRLAFVARGSAGKEQLATRPLDQAQATVLSGTENAVDPFFSPDGRWIGFFADGKMKKIPVRGGAVVTLCDAPGPGGASWGEDGSIIATLTLTNSGLSRVAAGGTPQAITKPGEKGEFLHRWPQILPGGQAVLFTGNTSPADYDNASIEVLSLKSGQWKVVQRGGYFGRYLPSGHLLYIHQGKLFAVGFDLDRQEIRGTPAPLLEDVAGNAAFGGGQYDVARNGTLVYLSGKPSNAGWPIAWMDATGKTQPLVGAPGLYFFPRFSPDGTRLALAVGSLGNGDVQVYDWQRDTMTRLTFTQRIRRLVWTPDGKHIAFAFQSPDASIIRWIRADGAGEEQTLREFKGRLGVSSFSPDGKRLAFQEGGVDTGLDLWTLPLDVSDPEHPKPGKPELFLRTPFDEYDPIFSPDGRWIAYTSRESGPNEVYVRPFPGGTASRSGKWQISSGGGSSAIWSRSGRELFYESPDNHIMATAYTASADSFTAGKPRPWSNAQIFEPVPLQWDFDLAPDGKRFAVIPRPEAASEQKGSVHVTVLLNFLDELRRRVPR
jgi:Tol biopolymer transport system component/predicted Ser/Thr protein kinase